MYVYKYKSRDAPWCKYAFSSILHTQTQKNTYSHTPKHTNIHTNTTSHIHTHTHTLSRKHTHTPTRTLKHSAPAAAVRRNPHPLLPRHAARRHSLTLPLGHLDVFIFGTLATSSDIQSRRAIRQVGGGSFSVCGAADYQCLRCSGSVVSMGRRLVLHQHGL